MFVVERDVVLVSGIVTLNFFLVRASALSRLSALTLYGYPLRTCRTRERVGLSFWWKNPGTRMTRDRLQTLGSPPRVYASSCWNGLNRASSMAWHFQ